MPLESATYLSQLNASNPLASDGVQQGDDHLRLIKAALQNTFENFTDAPLTSTQAQLDGAVTAIANGTLKLTSGAVGAPGIAFKNDTHTGFYLIDTNTFGGAVGGQQFVQFNADKSVAFKGALSTVGAITGPGAVPIGGSIQWWTDTLPDEATWGKFAWLNGQVIANANTACPVLLSMWGSTYGGNGVTTMGVPDTRDNVPVGKSTMGGVSSAGRIVSGVTNFVSSTLGVIFGTALHTLTATQMPAHTHSGTTGDDSPDHTHGYTAPAANGGSDGGPFGSIFTPSGQNTGGASTRHQHLFTTNSQGGGGAHNNVQPSVVCNWVVRIA